MNEARERRRATAIGAAAILMWSLFALMTASTGPIPPFALNAVAFAIGGGVGLAWVVRRGRIRALVQPWPVWLHGLVGLFGYHALYFTAMKSAPPVEVSLICYLWPLLIVLLSTALPGERLRPHHLIGAVMGLAGATLLVTGGKGLAFESRHAFGYGAALGCAIIWAAYSVLSRRLKAVPTEAVAGFCLVTALMSAACHLLLEAPVPTLTGGQWLAVAAIGLMPVGIGFYAWDYAMKRGDIQVLGAGSYAAPLLSTLFLIAAGHGEATPATLAACVLITLGAVVAARELFRRRAPAPAVP